MKNSTEETLAQLRQGWPGWHIWIVVRAVSKPTILWCAKPEYETQPILNENSAGELAAQIAKHAS